MSLHSLPLRTGYVTGTIYTFENAGDVLPLHSHTKGDVHITVVARGEFRISGPQIGSHSVGAGTVLDWEPGVAHEFEALTDNARLVNIIK